MSTQLSKAYTGEDVNDLKFDVEAPEELPSDELEDEDEEPVKNSRGMILHAVIVSSLAMIGLYALTLVTFAGTTLMTAAFVAFGVGGCVMVAEVKLSKMDTFRTIHNRLRKDVNVFAGENVKLTKANDALNLQVFMLKENEQRFQALAAEQNSNVQDLVKLVNENQKVIDEKKKCIRDDIIESLISTAFEGERSQDGEFSDREVKRLVTRLKNMPAVKINEEILSQVLDTDRSVLALIAIIRDLDVAGEQIGDTIFLIDENDPALLEDLTAHM
ncbi:unnamed protein product [Cylindrotheca closterium]|uniref:Uncharacterized protein n=1 Tax=Cylindrotheca closterium TaxID=2856 RepID=A0AAD2PWL9_9STRA|nr:unnamed protein product [Cylindrotheca closterium]